MNGPAKDRKRGGTAVASDSERHGPHKRLKLSPRSNIEDIGIDNAETMKTDDMEGPDFSEHMMQQLEDRIFERVKRRSDQFVREYLAAARYSQIGTMMKAALKQQMETEGRYITASPPFLSFLHDVNRDKWLPMKTWDFMNAACAPKIGDDVSVCQSFVTNVVRTFKPTRRPDVPPTIAATNRKGKQFSVPILSVLKDTHEEEAFPGRRPALVGFDRAGGDSVCDIIFFGDVTGRDSDDDFADAQVGHVLEMARKLMEMQHGRQDLYFFLTDGYKFQFFLAHGKWENNRLTIATFEHSRLYFGQWGWMVVAGLLVQRFLGYIPLYLPLGYRIGEYLGAGGFSHVYAVTKTDAQKLCIVKVFDDCSARDQECDILTTLHSQIADVRIKQHLPRVLASVEAGDRFPSLILAPKGRRIQPLSGGVRTMAKDFIPLVRVLQEAHRLQIYHRDVKPDNVFWEISTTTVAVGGRDAVEVQHRCIFLSDWSSAHRSTLYPSYFRPIWVGSRYFTVSVADQEGCHMPSAAHDLCSLVRTAQIVSHNQLPPAPRDEAGYFNREIEGVRTWRKAYQAAQAGDYDELCKRLKKC